MLLNDDTPTFTHSAYYSTDILDLVFSNTKTIGKIQSMEVSEDFRSDLFSLATVAYELLNLELPYDGLGGRAVTIAGTRTSHFELVLPSKHPSFRWKTTKRARRLTDAIFVNSLAIDPDQRFGTRSDWLSAWDTLHRELQKGTRLTGWQEKLVNGIERVSNIALLKRKN